jgi:iron complex outermembrane receptor protein
LEAKLGPVDAWVKADTVSANESYRSAIGLGPYDEAEFPTGSLGPGTAFGFTQPGFTEMGSVTQNPTTASNPRVFSTNTPNEAHLTNDYNVTTQVTWHTPWDADLKYIGGFTRYLYNLTEDFDGTSLTSYQVPTIPSLACFPATQCPPLTLFPTVLFNYREDKTYYSNELNLTSTGSGNFQWILGAFEYHEQYFQFVRIPLPDQAQLATPLSASFGPSPANPTRDIYAIEQHTSADSYAGFAQGDWQVIPTVKLTGGVRYTYDQEQGIEDTRQLCLGLPSCGAPVYVYGAYTPVVDITQYLISYAAAPGVKGPPTYNATNGFWYRGLGATWSAVTGTAGVEWTPDSESLVYAKYSRGYKAGGFNTGAIVAAPETQPEYIDAYEIGGKRDFGSQFQANVAFFYYNYDGMQIPLGVQLSPSVPIMTEFFNMKQVISYGAELETVWRPVDNAQIIFNYSYLSATIHDNKGCFVDTADPTATEPGANPANCTGGAQSVNGETVPESPPNKLALSGNYTWHFEPGALTLSGTVAWQDATYDSIFNRFYTKAPAYDTVDLRLLWTDVKNRYTVIVYGKNIFNSLGYDNAGATLETNGVLNRTFGLTPPATYGVELQYRL